MTDGLFLNKASRANAILFLLLVLAALCYFSREALSVIVESWGIEEYSHGFFIPVITLVLLFNKMQETAVIPTNSWFGVVAVTLCMSAQFLFQIAGVRGILPELYVLSMLGLIAVFWGMKPLRLWAGPLGFLLFAAPLPHYFYYGISFAMQSVSTRLGTVMLELANVPVFRDGNVIDLGGYKLQVAEACSGLRYLFPLLSLSYLFAYIYKAPFIKRLILFVSAVPVAIFMNALRIAVIGMTVDKWGGSMAEGPLHEFEGLLVFAGCIACLLLEIRLMEMVGRRSRLDFSCLRVPRLPYFTAPALAAPAYAVAILVMLALAADTVMVFTIGFVKEVPLRQSFDHFPLKLGNWVGRFDSIDAESLAILGTTNYLLADYTKAGSTPVNLYMLYYPFQDSSSNQAIHSPYVCIPAGGWTIVATAQKTLTLKDGEELAVNTVVITKNNVRELVYYWFIQGGKATPSPDISKFYQVRNVVLNHQANGAMVRMVTEIKAGETEEEADKRLIGFLHASVKTIDDFMFKAGN